METDNSEKMIRERMYTERLAALEIARQASYDKYDKAILTLSMAALGFTLGFGQIGMSGALKAVGLLQTSWWLFFFSISTIMISNLLVPCALRNEEAVAYDYYVGENEHARQRKNLPNEVVKYMNILSGTFFVAGVIVTIFFFSENLYRGEVNQCVKVIQKIEKQ